MTFIQRTKAPDTVNSEWYKGKPGTGNNIGQCTWYACGRSSEIANHNVLNWSDYPNETENPMLYWEPDGFGYPHARYWFEYANWEKINADEFINNTASFKEGMILCYTGPYGHLAIIENVVGDIITITDYNKNNDEAFKRSILEKQAIIDYNGSGNFQGVIINPDAGNQQEDKTDPETTPTPSENKEDTPLNPPTPVITPPSSPSNSDYVDYGVITNAINSVVKELSTISDELQKNIK